MRLIFRWFAALWLISVACTLAAQQPVNPSIALPEPPGSFAPLDVITTTDAVLFSRPEIERSMRKAADYGLKVFTDPGHSEWIRSTFYIGVLATYSTTSDTRYLDATTSWAAALNFTTSTRDRGRADNQCCGQVYCELYLMKDDPQMLRAIQSSFDDMVRARPKGRVEWWWCDALFMAPPGLARMAAAVENPHYVDLMNTMYWDSWDFLFDRNENLFYRDQSYFYVRTTKNCQKIFWSRGNGWVLAGLARILQYLPQDNTSRPRYIELFQKMATRIAGLQQADGTWRSSLLDPDEYPLAESSGSGFFCYGIAWGINNGLLDREQFLPVVKRAWRGLNSVLSPDGKVGYVQPVAGAPGTVSREQTQEYAVGAFLLAGSEVAKLGL